MFTSEKKIRKEISNSKNIDSTKIDDLISDLGSNDGLVRQQARIVLVHLGQPAVAALIKAFQKRKGYTHWEAAKALSQIGDPASVNALIAALEDEQFNIRWLAAEGLIAVGRSSVEPLLRALIDRSNSVRLREGAHHVFHDLVEKDKLEPVLRKQISQVLAVLRDVEPALATPLAAHAALQVLNNRVS